MRCDAHADGVLFSVFSTLCRRWRARFSLPREYRLTMLSMNHLPVLDRNAFKPDSPGWGRAAGNIEDAKIALEGLKALVHDAVYLDEDAYTGALHASTSQSRLQVRSPFAPSECIISHHMDCMGTWQQPPSPWDQGISHTSYPASLSFIA